MRRLRFALVETYLMFLRQDVEAFNTPTNKIFDHKGGCLKVYIGAIGAVCNEFHSTYCPTKDESVRNLLKQYKDNDGTEQSEGFDMVNDLPKLWCACWNMPYWGRDMKIKCWAMFLVAMCIMGRASDLTHFCPTYEDMRVPLWAMWTADGYPLYVDIALRDWKKT